MLILFLCACGRKEDSFEEREYIEPVNDISVFSLLDYNVRQRIAQVNGGKDYRNDEFRMLNREVYGGVLCDIEGKPVDLSSYDRFFLEVASVNCSHCKEQLHDIVGLSKEEDIPFIQYFNVGDAEEVREAYAEEGLSIPDSLTVIAKDEDMKDYIVDYLSLEMYPTLICFDDGKVSFSISGTFKRELFPLIKDIAFVRPLTADDLKDAYGNDAIGQLRTMEDVRKDLDPEKLRLIGRKADLSVHEKHNSTLYYSEVDDFSIYADRQLVLFYTMLNGKQDREKIKFINELMTERDGLEYLVVLIEGADSSSAALRNMDVRFNCPVVSVLGDLPDDLFGFGLVSYPTAVFMDRGVFAGAYSKIKDVPAFEEALDIFLSDDSIAYRK